jgi:hypothetical protein
MMNVMLARVHVLPLSRNICDFFQSDVDYGSEAAVLDVQWHHPARPVGVMGRACS